MLVQVYLGSCLPEGQVKLIDLFEPCISQPDQLPLFENHFTITSFNSNNLFINIHKITISIEQYRQYSDWLIWLA